MPKKKPRAAYRRFVYPAPDACWQLDATEYVLTGGRKCVIFQLQDDHSSLAIATHGVTQRLLNYNGMVLNPSRRRRQGPLVAYVSSLGVEVVSDKPNKPTTQGKNGRFHQALFRWLDKLPLAHTHDEFQDQVGLFNLIYNTERPNQSLPGRPSSSSRGEPPP